MPEISRFYGIIIKMYFWPSEHQPPHIHAIYQGYIIAIALNDYRAISGWLPDKAKALVIEWMKLHQTELQEMWDKQVFKKISPLE